jgi:hypothetical protein
VTKRVQVSGDAIDETLFGKVTMEGDATQMIVVTGDQASGQARNSDDPLGSGGDFEEKTRRDA